MYYLENNNNKLEQILFFKIVNLYLIKIFSCIQSENCQKKKKSFCSVKIPRNQSVGYKLLR